MKGSLILGLIATTVAVSPLIERESAAAATYVDLSSQQGAPQHLASGFIYGIPDTYNQIPGHFYTDIGFRYGRAGGAQEGAPNRGWIWGFSNYQGRFNSALINYKTCREYGADFIILPHDIWGTDQANSTTVWPGDNGDWTDYENFIHQLMSDLKANDALEGLVWDIWNEPEGKGFWARSMQQWIELYVLTHKLIRGDQDFDNVLISGPTLSSAPYPTSVWWTNWMEQVKENETIPDQYAYHLEANPGSTVYDLQNTYPSLNSMLASYGLPQRQQNINEYASSKEQIPAGAAWWIARLERYNVFGLRGNWRSGTTLHDLFANLLTKSDPFNYTATDYEPAPEYTVYQYYYNNMTGVRVKTTGSTDLQFDVYATAQSNGKVRILSGTQVANGTWSINVGNLSDVGLPTSGTIDIQTWSFPGNQLYSAYYYPTNRGVRSHTYSNNSISFPVYQTTDYTAYAFEFSCGDFHELIG